jgi:hypothetical protein
VNTNRYRMKILQKGSCHSLSRSPSPHSVLTTLIQLTQLPVGGGRFQSQPGSNTKLPA